MKPDSLKRLQRLVVLLADGRFHSGEDLANKLYVSRTAIWKLISKLQSWQIEIYAVRGKGYKIPGGLLLIDQDYLIQQLKDELQLFSIIEVKPTIDSTSSYLTRTWKKEPGISRICIAEHQTEGRGRNGRKWVSPFGANLYFSLGLNFPMGLSALGGLSLAVGIGLTRLLDRLSKEKVTLKWPNDVLLNQRKLAGILVEASGDSNGHSFLNIGIGLNWNMIDQGSEIDQPWVNLLSSLTQNISRNELLVQILKELDLVLTKYIEEGFGSFRNDWTSYSAFYGKPIVIRSRKGDIAGKEVGIDKNGAIIIETAKGEKVFFSGEVSLRANKG